MGNSHKHLPGFAVPLGDEGLEGFAQGFVSRLVSLYNLSRPLVKNQQMIVFQKDAAFYVPVLFRAYFPIDAHNAAKIALFSGKACGIGLAVYHRNQAHDRYE